jgi:itaconate CoA-transferase
VQNNREWVRFCADVLRRPELGADPRFASNSLRVQHRDAMTADIETALSQLTSSELVQRMEAADIAYARVNSVAEYLQHPQLRERDCWRSVESPVGPIRAMVPPVRIGGIDPVMGAVPALGQHSRSVLEEFRFDRATIARWADAGVI